MNKKTRGMLVFVLFVLVLTLSSLACDSSGGTCDKIETCNPAADVMAQPEFKAIDKANDVLFPQCNEWIFADGHKETICK